ncbi:MAG: hypothetical protein OHK0045_05820 [Raineya sp.]
MKLSKFSLKSRYIFKNLFVLTIFISHYTGAQSDFSKKIENVLERERDISKVLYEMDVLLSPKSKEVCSILDSLLMYRVSNAEQKAILYTRYLLYCKANHFQEKDFAYLEEILTKLPNACDKIIFYVDIAWFLTDKGIYPEIVSKYLRKAERMQAQKNCQVYRWHLLYYEAQKLQKEYKNDLALAKMIEAEQFFLDNQLHFYWNWVELQNNLAFIYYRSENYDSAEKHWLKALEKVQEMQWQDRNIVSSINSLGLAQTKQGKYEEAAKNFSKSSNLAQKIGDSIWIAIPQGNLAEIDLLRKDYPAAEKKLTMYYKYALRFKEHGIVVAACIKMAKLYKEQSNLAKALEYLELGEVYFEKHTEDIRKISFLSVLDYQKRLTEGFVEVLEAKGDYQRALYYSKKLININDSISVVLRKEKIDIIEAHYKIREKENENKTLKSLNVEQAKNLEIRSNLLWIELSLFLFVVLFAFYAYAYFKTKRKYINNLEDLNLFKSKLFSIISHDLRSYMSSLKGYVYLIKNQEMPPEGQAELNEELAKNTEYASNLLENLLFWAKGQIQGQKINLSPNSVRELLQESLSEIFWFSESKKIQIELSCPEDVQVYTDKSLFSIIMRNILTNSIKFSNPQQKIELSVSLEKSFCKLLIKDYGKGISPENLERIHKKINFSERGTQMEKGTGLGLMLIQQTAKQLKMQFHIDSQLGKGTSIALVIPTSL